ncbi:MAG: toll/interleukin-1 receptor domain-containing protein [Oscillospiraceae bacterium]|nr:toll/interleukin-1 receptor domain-containing protein [Oscillospiraceae bacterium]
MPSFRKPNMSKFNSAMNKLKSANSQFQREANKTIRDLKSIESKAKSAQRQFSRPTIISTGSNYENVLNLYEALHEHELPEHTRPTEVRDVFVSYAHEDKTSFVQPLVNEMKNRDISRWYDEEQQANMWGRSLREEIDSGIRLSKFCIVVFSKAYFKKYWTKKELDGILMKERIDNGQILPIWHNIDEHDMYEFSPSLTGLLAFSTQVYTINEICDALESKIRNEEFNAEDENEELDNYL